jgi:hypothetical protein
MVDDERRALDDRWWQIKVADDLTGLTRGGYWVEIKSVDMTSTSLRKSATMWTWRWTLLMIVEHDITPSFLNECHDSRSVMFLGRNGGNCEALARDGRGPWDRVRVPSQHVSGEPLNGVCSGCPGGGQGCGWCASATGSKDRRYECQCACPQWS